MSRDVKAHVLIIPFPVQGHVSPIVQFGKRLTQKGIKVTVAYTNYLYKTAHFYPSGFTEVALFSDGYDDYGPKSAKSVEDYIESFKTAGNKDLRELVSKTNRSSQPFTAIIYDSFIPWILDIAKSFNLKAAVFLTQPLAVNFIYYQVHRGNLPFPLTGDNISVPGFPKFSVHNAPYFVSPAGYGKYPNIENVVINQFEGIEEADWILTNIFYELEPELSDWFRQRWRFAAIGPTVPSMFVDRRIEDDKAYELSVFVSDSTTCMSWLNQKPVGSVVYVSFGSMAELGREQMEELAWGLRQSGKFFVWVVRASEADKLPENYASDVSEMGLVVSWCPQLDVLAHQSVGCFVTHCGFNSIMEAVCLGVPMVAMPQWTDQPTNAMYVEDVWKICIRPKTDETRVVRREVIAEYVKLMIEGKHGRKLKDNSMKWKELAKKAVSEGGSSDQGICSFVADLVRD